MIACKRCKKQYIGETKRTIRERFTEHRQATNNPCHANTSGAVPTHFNLPDHSIEDMTLIPLELLQPTPQYLTRESKGGVSDTQRPNARTEWNEPQK